MRIDGEETAVRLPRHHLRAGHDRNGGSIDVGVQQPDGGSALAQRGRQVDGYRRLADATLAGRDGDRLLDAGQYLRRFGSHEGGPHVGRHADLDAGHAGQLADGVLGLRLEAIPGGTCRRRELKGEGHLAFGAYVQLLDHAQADHVPAQVRVLDVPEHVQDLLRSWRAHRLRSYRATATEVGPPDKFSAA